MSDDLRAQLSEIRDQLRPRDGEGTLEGVRRRGAVRRRGQRIVALVCGLSVGVFSVALAVHTFSGRDIERATAASWISSPAPRSDCPIGIVRMRTVPITRFESLSNGHLPTWLPDGFGLQATYGVERAADGITSFGVWSDDRCREVELTFNASWVARADSAVPAWILEDNVPRGCGNSILGKARCLDLSTTTSDGGLALQMMGIDLADGDRIAASILHAPVIATDREVVPQDIQQAARSYASTRVCANGSFSGVSRVARVDAAGLATLEPDNYAGVTIALGSMDTPQVTSETDPVYAVFLRGACRRGGRVYAGARVLLNADGDVMEVQAWARGDRRSRALPFGPLFDGQ